MSTNNATEEQIMKDRYACYQETQQQVSTAYVNRYGGAAPANQCRHVMRSMHVSRRADIAERTRPI
jgi:hypothetical protein